MGNKTMPAGEFCWNELMTPDTKKAKEFYTQLLGWEAHDHDMGECTYTMFKHKGKDLMVGMMQTPKGMEKEIPPHWMGYILVEDLDASVKKAQSLGATIKVPQQPVGDFGRFAILVDPTGAHIALWQSIQKHGEGCC